ncbi:MAG: histidine utilization repressor [Rhizobiales bacterium]|nr:histidine utilization repressor [Hyphomicrobiales bacterium]
MTSLVLTQAQPLYVQLKEHILARIRSREWAPGSRVLSENEIVEQFSVSRMTANRALKELTQEGFLARVPGVGTFVKEPPQRASLLEIRNIADEIAARGHFHSSEIAHKGLVDASPAIAEEFETNAGARLFHITMVHRENGVPVQLEDRYVNPLAAPDFLNLDFAGITPTAYLVANVPVDELEHTVEAMMPSPQEQALLDVPAGEPCLTLHRRSWSRDRVVTAVRFTYPASRHALYSRYRPSGSNHSMESDQT